MSFLYKLYTINYQEEHYMFDFIASLKSFYTTIVTFK